MNKLLPVLLGVIVISSCSRWRQREWPDPKVVLPSNTWEFYEHLYVHYTEPGRDCRLPQYLVYREDGTGFFTYPNSCDSPKVDSIKFTWSYNAKTYRLSYKFQNGPYIGLMMAESQVAADYDRVILTCRTPEFSFHTATHYLIDGNFRPVTTP